MTDVLPVVFVGADENLAIQLIGWHGKRRHVRRKLKESRQTFDVDETETAGKRNGWSVFVRGREDEAPLAKTWNIDVIGMRLKAGLLERLCDAPERVASKHGRSALYDHQALCAEVARGGAIKSRGVELPQRIIGGIRKIDRDEIKTVGREGHLGGVAMGEFDRDARLGGVLAGDADERGLMSSPTMSKSPSLARAIARYPGPGAISRTRAPDRSRAATRRASFSNPARALPVFLAYQSASLPSITTPLSPFLAGFEAISMEPSSGAFITVYKMFSN